MASPISEDITETFGTIPRPRAAADSLELITAPSTEFAPKGRIIHDRSRGTVFWEAELNDEDPEDKKACEAKVDGELQTWGKTFNVDWISIASLPFRQTRGMRNPWNANREIKIARDGTEIEPSVGKRLLQLFQQEGSGPLGQTSTSLGRPPYS